jgi:outer membrane murein-binding lipoprotein Lpp
MRKQNKVGLILVALLLLAVVGLMLSGCKKEEKVNETTLATEADEIDAMIKEVEGLNINVDLGEESLTEEESLIS